MKPDLSVKIGNMILNNPVMPASGTFGYGEEFSEFFDLNLLGAIVTKGLSYNGKPGNKPPRIFEGERYLINAIGLENIGFKRFAEEKLPFLKKLKCRKIVNFFGNTEEDYYKIAEQLNLLEEIDALEVNVSCPNVKEGGIEFGLSEKSVYKLIKNIRKIVDKKTLIVKISPMLSDVVAVGLAVEEAGADAITAINTLKGFSFDIENKKYNIANKFGGVSGPLLKPVALRIVKELSEKISIPIIGVGGIWSYKDVLEFLFAGAKAVQIGTANFSNPLVLSEIIRKLVSYMNENNIESMSEFCKCLNC